MSEELKTEFYLADFIEEELAARKWSVSRLVVGMMLKEFQVTLLAMEMLLTVRDRNLKITEKDCFNIADALGLEHETMVNLAKSCNQFMEVR